MGKRPMAIGASLLLLLVLLSGVGDPARAGAENLLENGGFELVDPEGKGLSWRKDFWRPASFLGLTKAESRRGNAAFLHAEEANDIRLVQTVKVEPDKIYRFSGWAAVRNVPERGLGANLCVMGGFIHSPGLRGTTGWRPLELVFRTRPNQSQVTLGLRLGYYGETTTGTAFFDDLALEEVKEPGTAHRILGPEEEKAYFPTGGPPAVTGERPWEKRPAAKAPSLLQRAAYPGLILLFYLLACLPLALRPEEESLLPRKPDWWEKKGAMLFLLAAALNLLARLALLGAAPFPGDMSCFKAWALRMAAVGPRNFYAEGFFCDYPPFGLYILWLAGGIINAFNLAGSESLSNAMLKFPALACDLLTAWLIFRLLRRKDPRRALLAAVIYMFLPAVIYNSSYWGQVDTYYTYLMMLAFYFIVRDKPACAAAFVAASFLTKPQTAAFLPVLVFFMFIHYKPRRIMAIIGAAILAAVLILLPFNLGKPLTWIFTHYAGMAGEYEYASLNAANFHALLSGNGRDDDAVLAWGLTYRTLGVALFFALCVWCCLYLYHRRTRAGLAAVFAAASFGFFLFFPRMHERYLFPFFPFLLLSFGYLRDRRLYALGILAGMAYLFNLHAVVLRYSNALPETAFARAIYILALANTGIFAALLLLLQERLPGWGRRLRVFLRRYETGLSRHLSETPQASPFILRGKDYLLLGSVLALYGVFIFLRLGSWATPQKGTEIREPLEVILPSPASIGAVAVYDAEGTGGFAVEKYAGGVWTPGASVSCENFYVLKRVPFPAGKVERLRLVPRPSTGRINEIAFLGPQGKILPVEYVIGADGRRLSADESPLFDEGERMRAGVSYLNSTYFDEIYHGRTAYEFLQRTPVYETTHPPLGKALIALGIAAFGMNPFGMRFIPALLGVVLMGVLFFLGREVLARRFGAYGVMALGMLDFMPFVQSRYSTIDTPSVLLISLMFLFTFRLFRRWEGSPEGRAPLKDAVFALFFFALAAAVKWTAVYGFAGAASIFLLTQVRRYCALKRKAALEETAERKKKKSTPKAPIPAGRIVLTDLGLVLLIFLILVPAVYYLTYPPFLRCSGITDIFSREAVAAVVRNQKDMYDYHSQLKATHPFSSSWWSWPFDFKPLWLYPDKPVDFEPGKRASIVSMGNPLIWWAGIAAVILVFYRLLAIRRLSVMHLVFLGFLAQYLPWILVGRITFIYHFYPVLPFCYLFIAAALRPLWEAVGSGRRVAVWFFLFSLLLFILFYPVLSGLEVPRFLADSLRWFPMDWAF